MFSLRNTNKVRHSGAAVGGTRNPGDWLKRKIVRFARGSWIPGSLPKSGAPLFDALNQRSRLRDLWVRPGMTTLALALVLGVSASAQSQREHWASPGEAFKIIDNTYYVGTGGIAVYLITTPQGHFLIDGAVPEAAAQIEQHIKDLGFKPSDVKYLLTTHAHFDHTGGLAQLKKDTGATFLAMEGDVSALESGSYLGSESNHSLDSVPIKVDRALKPGEQLTLGGVTLTANLTPGHTRGCTSWGWTVQDGGKAYQVLDFCSATVAANRLVGPPQYPGIVADYTKTFAKAKTGWLIMRKSCEWGPGPGSSGWPGTFISFTAMPRLPCSIAPDWLTGESEPARRAALEKRIQAS